jgi:predicted TIM-barrel fold metal-dependent hydrolase
MLRRTLLLGALQGPAALVDTHLHFFAKDQKRFPYHPQGTYQPPPEDVEDYARFAPAVGITQAVIVHPEPYQDDHRYLEYCFGKEPKPGFFKGTCLLDGLREDTPRRLDELMKRMPGRIRALRIHRLDEAAQRTGPIRERPLEAPEMRRTWKAVAERGLMVQMHFTPRHAKAIETLAKEFGGVKVILDHLARNNQGTDAEWRDVLALGKLPNTVMKVSGLDYSPRLLGERVKQVFETFGPERMIWGGLGYNAEAYAKAKQRFEELLGFAREEDRARIRGGNALRLYGWV